MNQERSAQMQCDSALCKCGGVAIVCCAEPFQNAGFLPSSIMIGLKRDMAAEHSRELSVFRGRLRDSPARLPSGWDGGLWPPSAASRRTAQSERALDPWAAKEHSDRPCGSRPGPLDGHVMCRSHKSSLIPSSLPAKAAAARNFHLCQPSFRSSIQCMDESSLSERWRWRWRWRIHFRLKITSVTYCPPNAVV